MKHILVGLALVSSLAGLAQVGSPFPSLTGELLEGGNRPLPAGYAGRMTLVGLAWSRKAEDALSTWYTPLHDKFVLKRGVMDEDYDVQLCFVPMYIGLKQAAYEATLQELRTSNRPDLFPYILFYRGPLEPYDSKLGLTDKQIPYFFLLDENGVIRYATSGAFSEAKLERMEEVINREK